MLVSLALVLFSVASFFFFTADAAYCTSRLGTYISDNDCRAAMERGLSFLSKVVDTTYFVRGGSGDPTDLPRGWSHGSCSVIVDLDGRQRGPLLSSWRHHVTQLGLLAHQCVIAAGVLSNSGTGGFSIVNGFQYIVFNPTTPHMPILPCMKPGIAFTQPALQCLSGMTGDEIRAVEAPVSNQRSALEVFHSLNTNAAEAFLALHPNAAAGLHPAAPRPVAPWAPPPRLSALATRLGALAAQSGTQPDSRAANPLAPPSLIPPPLPVVPIARLGTQGSTQPDTQPALPRTGTLPAQSNPPGGQTVYDLKDLKVETSLDRVIWNPWDGNKDRLWSSGLYLRIALKGFEGPYPNNVLPLPQFTKEKFIRRRATIKKSRARISGAWVAKDGSWMTETELLQEISLTSPPRGSHGGQDLIDIFVIFGNHGLTVEASASGWLEQKYWILLQGPAGSRIQRPANRVGPSDSLLTNDPTRRVRQRLSSAAEEGVSAPAGGLAGSEDTISHNFEDDEPGPSEAVGPSRMDPALVSEQQTTQGITEVKNWPLTTRPL